MSGRRRIDDSHDLVRLEIEAALTHDLRVIPVLLEGAHIPDQDDLPNSLRSLAYRQGLRVTHESFRYDAQRLITALESTLESAAFPQESVSPPPRQLNFPSPSNLVFVGYSHKDERALERLQVHLKPLARYGRIQLWDDTQLVAGDEWRDEIKSAIESCRAAILLVSADFMASDFVYTDELPPLLTAAKNRGVRIIPIIVSSSSYEDSELGKFQAINPLSKPLDMLSWGEQQIVFVNVYRAVRNMLRN